MKQEGKLWNRIMKAALAIPGVSLDREEYLRSALKGKCSPEALQEAIEYRPAVALSRQEIDSLASNAITYHTSAVTTLSTLTGLPGGPVILASIPADLAQYYYHVFVLAQKLAYLYGFPDLRDEEKHLSDDSCDMLTLFVGVMLGAQVANRVLHDIARDLAVQVAKKMPQKVLARTIYYPIVSQVAKHIGADLSRSSLTKTFGKVIPLLGGLVSGTVTYLTFSKGSRRLQKALHRQMNLLGEDPQAAVSAGEEAGANGEEALQRLAMQTLVNMALMDEREKERKRQFLLERITHTTLPDDEKEQLLASYDEAHTYMADFRAFRGDPVSSTQLMRRLAELLRLTNPPSVSAKIYLNKISRELGYSARDVEEFLHD